MNTHIVINFFYINIIEKAITISVRKENLLNLYSYPSEISFADFGDRQYLGNIKSQVKVLIQENEKDVYNFVTKFYFSQIEKLFASMY